MFPKRMVASVVGIGGMVGAIGGVIIARTTGVVLDYYKSLNNIEFGYSIMFVICAFAYLIAWLLFSLLVPKMPRAEI
jgi:ACS family hexuronate transporter-like MFS transporter